MAKKPQKIEEKPPKNITLAEALGERYLSYALSTITSRSLPDVRDGLKPVHRRLLYAMRQLKLDPVKGFKSALVLLAMLLESIILMVIPRFMIPWLEWLKNFPIGILWWRDMEILEI